MPIVHYLPPKSVPGIPEDMGAPPFCMELSSTLILIQPPKQRWRKRKVKIAVSKIHDKETKKWTGEWHTAMSPAWEFDPTTADIPEAADEHILDISKGQLAAIKRGNAMSAITPVAAGPDKREGVPKDCVKIIHVKQLAQYVRDEKDVMGELKTTSAGRITKLKKAQEKQELELKKEYAAQLEMSVPELEAILAERKAAKTKAQKALTKNEKAPGK